MVAVHGYEAQPVRVTFKTWLALTDKAVALVVERAVDVGREWAELSVTERNAWRWLVTSGLDDADKLEGYKSRRPLFELPGDPGNLVRCACCGRVLVNPLSKALAMGPECRLGKCNCRQRTA
jgi:hypothetical protein